jgi:hypothetical protein
MTDFLDAFKRGQDAAARAAQARAEIQAVLKGASDELATAMDGKLRLVLQP